VNVLDSFTKKEGREQLMKIENVSLGAKGNSRAWLYPAMLAIVYVFWFGYMILADRWAPVCRVLAGFPDDDARIVCRRRDGGGWGGDRLSGVYEIATISLPVMRAHLA
jgi:hypothetical protein